MGGIGKILIFAGLMLVLLGIIFALGEKIPYIGKLPGDIHIKKERFSFYFPLTTSLLISLILTIIFSILKR
ncbi:MAG: DUF2905 domain-containing protein [Desulfobacterota bacterium]|nr:DUF2905 domain-containing protein [Thermodesulfobacteriota bacterium]MDW8002545.1 DUF2905 domain-containing protein [Deltaproteobacteria bacterium]